MNTQTLTSKYILNLVQNVKRQLISELPSYLPYQWRVDGNYYQPITRG
ncbi:MAG: hypothetical protein AAFY41_00275 [Bacteroidota bacterium]